MVAAYLGRHFLHLPPRPPLLQPLHRNRRPLHRRYPLHLHPRCTYSHQSAAHFIEARTRMDVRAEKHAAGHLGHHRGTRGDKVSARLATTPPSAVLRRVAPAIQRKLAFSDFVASYKQQKRWCRTRFATDGKILTPPPPHHRWAGRRAPPPPPAFSCGRTLWKVA